MCTQQHNKIYIKIMIKKKNNHANQEKKTKALWNMGAIYEKGGLKNSTRYETI